MNVFLRPRGRGTERVAVLPSGAEVTVGTRKTCGGPYRYRSGGMAIERTKPGALARAVARVVGHDEGAAVRAVAGIKQAALIPHEENA